MYQIKVKRHFYVLAHHWYWLPVVLILHKQSRQLEQIEPKPRNYYILQYEIHTSKLTHFVSMAFGLKDVPEEPNVARQGELFIIFLILTWPSLFLRLYVRRCVINSLGPDDWFMVAALVLFTANAVCTYKSVQIALLTTPGNVDDIVRILNVSSGQVS